VLGWEATLNVAGCVYVVAIVGMGRNVCANCTAEVGYRGAVAVAVIAVGGIGCIGAYLTVPSWRLYGTVNIAGSSAPGAPGAGGAAIGAVAILLIAAGGVVTPPTANAAAETGAGNAPVIPVREKWLENTWRVPPAVPVHSIEMKL
jgi:hypothetical protein